MTIRAQGAQIGHDDAVGAVGDLSSRYGGVWRLSATTKPAVAQYWWETTSAIVFEGGFSLPDFEFPLADTAGVDVFHGTLLGERVSPRFHESDSTFLLHVPYTVPADEVDELDSWYTTEHEEMVMSCRDWTAVRRYRPLAGSTAPWNRLIVHELLTGDVLSSASVRAAMATPARHDFARRPWFLAGGRMPVALIETSDPTSAGKR
jgi:hypothetical protein